MFRLLLRFLGLSLLATGFVTLIVDVAHSIAGGGVSITPISDTLMELAPAKFATAQAFIEHHIHPFIWNPLLVGFMHLPLWLGLGMAGCLVSWLGKAPAPKFGFSSR
jgi:hypothetical protein